MPLASLDAPSDRSDAPFDTCDAPDVRSFAPSSSVPVPLASSLAPEASCLLPSLRSPAPLSSLPAPSLRSEAPESSFFTPSYNFDDPSVSLPDADVSWSRAFSRSSSVFTLLRSISLRRSFSIIVIDVISEKSFTSASIATVSGISIAISPSPRLSLSPGIAMPTTAVLSPVFITLPFETVTPDTLESSKSSPEITRKGS